MKIIFLLLTAFFSFRATAAELPPIVVELFTAQGCAACPPADEFLGQLKNRPDIIALSFHVDYWNYLGWRDPHSLVESTARQKSYSQRLYSKMYTPQMVINGDDIVVGSSRQKVFGAISKQESYVMPVKVAITKSQSGLDINLQPIPRFQQKNLDIWLVRFVSEAVTEIKKGENNGLKIVNHNVVKKIESIAIWDGTPTSYQADYKSDNIAVLVQEADTGRIVGAGKFIKN